jgi:WD repeat-containing protein 48
MNASRARYTSSRKKISVTYTLRNEREPLNRSGVNKIRIDPKRKRLLAAGRDSIIRCWDVEGLNKTDGQCDCIMTMEHHTDWVNDMVICKDGSTLMSGSCDTSLKVWDLSRGICTSTLKPHKDYVQALAYSPQTEIVVSAGLDHELYLWDINTLRNLSSTKNTVSTIPLRGQKQSIYAVDINTQGSLIVSGSTEKALRIWDARNYQKIMKLKGHTDNVRSVILNDDGTECLSASSDGTVRLWSIGSQRCIETFRIHEGGVWTLAVDESFRYFYSSGKDKRVYITDMSEGGQESVLLFTEEYPVLSIALDTSADDMDYLWVGTTGTSINKWPATPNQQPTDEEEEHNGMEQQPVVTDIDEIDTSHERPLLTIPGATTIIDCKTLNNKRHVLTKDNTGNVALWDVLHAVKESELGMVDLDVEAQRRQEDLFIPNWFSCDIKTGLLSIRLEENDCFSAWVMGNNTNIPNTDDLKLNYGALMLKALFEHWPESHLAKQQQTVKEHSADPAEIPVLQEVFLSVMSQLSDPCAIGRALGLKDEEVNELPKGNQLEMYKMIYNKCSQETGLSYNAFQNALISIDHEELASKLEGKVKSV